MICLLIGEAGISSRFKGKKWDLTVLKQLHPYRFQPGKAPLTRTATVRDPQDKGGPSVRRNSSIECKAKLGASIFIH